MKPFILSCCTTADLTKEYLDKRNISYIYFHYEIDGQSYDDDLGQTMDFKTFYEKMRDGASTKTSQINVEEFKDYFRPFLEDDRDILHVTLSSGISGVINSANTAADELREEFPDRKIYIVDSLAASSGYGLLMEALASLRDEGKSILEVYRFLVENRKKVHHWFFTSDLTYLVRGGRVSKAAGFIGGALSICPLLNVNNFGGLVPREKIRTKKKVMAATVEKMKMFADGGTDYRGKCFISHSDCYDDARAVANMVEEAFPNLDGPVQIFYIGTTIGSHTGPGTVALFFWGEERVD